MGWGQQIWTVASNGCLYAYLQLAMLAQGHCAQHCPLPSLGLCLLQASVSSSWQTEDDRHGALPEHRNCGRSMQSQLAHTTDLIDHFLISI